MSRPSTSARHEAGQAPWQQWFTRHVTARPLRVELDLDGVHEYDEATGAFEASLGQIACWPADPGGRGFADLDTLLDAVASALLIDAPELFDGVVEPVPADQEIEDLGDAA